MTGASGVAASSDPVAGMVAPSVQQQHQQAFMEQSGGRIANMGDRRQYRYARLETLHARTREKLHLSLEACNNRL